MNTPTRARATERGQAALLVILALAIFLIGAMGLAIDGSHLYAQYQMAQAAADAAAQAGIRSIYTGTYANGSSQAFSGSFTCAANDPKTPCYYAQTLNGFNGTGDTVAVNASGTSVQVTVSRQVPLTLFSFIGSWTPTIQASATAAIASAPALAPVPILVTHPTLSGALNLAGSGTQITICGGPTRSIQVNSISSTSMSMSLSATPSIIDLTHAGPPDPGDCSSGQGADFGDWGGAQFNVNSIVTFGAKGAFAQPTRPIADPLASVSAPALNASWPTNKTAALPAGNNGCPAGSGGCTLYFPGHWTSAIGVANQNAVFAPGIYYLDGVSFNIGSNGKVFMAQGLTDSSLTTTPSITTCCGTSTAWTDSGTPARANALFYLTGPGNPASTGTINIYSSAGGCIGGTCSGLQGSPNGPPYMGTLFFVDRNAAAATHSIDGGASITLTGTIYTNSNPSQYQTLQFQGNGSNTTVIVGEIITNALNLQNTPGIKVSLNSSPPNTVDQLALVQ